MKLRDISLGDIIEIPHHHPARVTVTTYEHAGLVCGVFLVRLGWTAPEAGGFTTLPENTRVRRRWQCPPDAPIRQRAEADTGAALTALLTSLEN